MTVLYSVLNKKKIKCSVNVFVKAYICIKLVTTHTHIYIHIGIAYIILRIVVMYDRYCNIIIFIDIINIIIVIIILIIIVIIISTIIIILVLF